MISSPRYKLVNQLVTKAKPVPVCTRYQFMRLPDGFSQYAYEWLWFLQPSTSTYGNRPLHITKGVNMRSLLNTLQKLNVTQILFIYIQWYSLYLVLFGDTFILVIYAWKQEYHYKTKWKHFHTYLNELSVDRKFSI